MCGSGADETPFGVRVLEGRWSDAYLGRYPVRPGYAYVVWKGRHVAEPTELSDEEAAGFWGEVAQVARAVAAHARPVKMNWLSLGNGVPHLHVHLVPRPADDAAAGGPLEAEAFDRDRTPEVPSDVLSGRRPRRCAPSWLLADCGKAMRPGRPSGSRARPSSAYEVPPSRSGQKCKAQRLGTRYRCRDDVPGSANPAQAAGLSSASASGSKRDTSSMAR